jgi:hypothetical protein
MVKVQGSAPGPVMEMAMEMEMAMREALENTTGTETVMEMATPAALENATAMVMATEKVLELVIAPLQLSLATQLASVKAMVRARH